MLRVGTAGAGGEEEAREMGTKGREKEGGWQQRRG